jgi:hypothetical protein
MVKIDYENIFEKATLFRKKIIKDDLDIYLDYHKNI